jgi:NAD(P)-dependent dehydrogenase (short-subunit alcohol dehydrogenase family)
MDLDLAGKTALVTGGSKGIGAAIARALAAEGCHLHLAARTAADLETTRAEIAARHQVSVTTHVADLSKSAEQAALAGACADIDILINNAGAIPGGDLDGVDEATWRDAWDLKVFGYINMTRAIYKSMRERGRGVILNIIGLAGEALNAGYIAGSTGNAALMAFTRTLGGVSLEHGVRVLGINPGLVETERLVTLLTGRAQREFGDPSRYRELLKPMPLGRAATVEEVANVAAFLVSPRASYVSGIVVPVDGGTLSRGART